METDSIHANQELNKEANDRIDNSNDSNDKNKKRIILVALIILVLCLAGLMLYGVLVQIQNNENANNSVDTSNINNVVNSDDNDEEDVYGYARVAYIPGDGTFKEYYRILELHKNERDVVLTSYDIDKSNNTDERVDRVGETRVFKSKLYFLLHYSDLSVSIMYIDLNNKENDPVELLRIDKDKRVNDFAITDSYVYLNVSDLFYKYDINSKQFLTITEDDFFEIINQKYQNTTTAPKSLYINGKELVLNEKELVYDGKIIYVSNADTISLRYSFDGNITIFESSNCNEIKCDTLKNYKYNFSKKVMEETVDAAYSIYEVQYID